MTIGFLLKQRDFDRLNGVHADLVSVVKRAAAHSTSPFMVVEGLRSQEQCMINYGKGRTLAECVAKGISGKYAAPNLAKVTWLNHPLESKHADGKAVDLLPAPYDWKDPKLFDQLANAMKAAAHDLGVKIRWGADWNQNGKTHEKGETDSPHFELA